MGSLPQYRQIRLQIGLKKITATLGPFIYDKFTYFHSYPSPKMRDSSLEKNEDLFNHQSARTIQGGLPDEEAAKTSLGVINIHFFENNMVDFV